MPPLEGEGIAEAVKQEHDEARAETKREYTEAAAETADRQVLSAEDEKALKAIYRKLALLYHPDRYVQETDKEAIYARLMHEINQAKDREHIARLGEIASSQVDFGQGKVIDLELRVRGYPVEVLRACPITPAQRIDDEPAESSFLARVRVQVPETGALLRWLLGLGDNVEVVAPAWLRLVMREQTLKAARHYARLSGPGEVTGYQQG